MPTENIFHGRRILFAKLNDIEAKIPIIVAVTGEELSLPENHFNMTEQEKHISRLQLFIKKAKMFAYHDKNPTIKISGLASNNIILFGKPHQIAPNSIMQNEELFSVVKERAHKYLEIILNAPFNENNTETFLSNMIDRIYHTIKRACPHADEVIHLATMERDLSAPDASKNRLTAEFSKILVTELRKKITQNNELWKVELDRVLALKQRTSRAESHGVHRIAQQPLMLYQSRNTEEKITPQEKVIIVDDHIQAGAAIASAASEILESNANLLSIVCVSAHKNSHTFNIQPDVKDFITSLLPNSLQDIPKLNEILKKVGLTIETLTNFEGMLLSSILSDSNIQEHKSVFENLLKKYDASENIHHSLFKNQTNSLMLEFEKPKINFVDFENELMSAIHKGRYTVPYDKQIVYTDEDGQNIRKEIDRRSKLPWLLFDFDDTLHQLDNNTFTIFQNIIKTYGGIEIPIETIKQTRQNLKGTGNYQYQEMLLSFINQNNPNNKISAKDIVQIYQAHKNEEPFTPKMKKEDFLALRNKYRIGIITDGTTFESKVPKIKAVYGVDIDGYIYNDKILASKPSPEMFHAFCRTYDVKTRPIAFVGDREDLDGGLSRNAKLDFIKVDPKQPMIDMESFTKELNAIEEKRKSASMRWNHLRNVFAPNKSTQMPENKLEYHEIEYSTPVLSN